MIYPDPWAGEAKRLVEPRELPAPAQMWSRAHLGPIAVYVDRSIEDAAGALNVEVECFACLDRLRFTVEDE